MRVLVIEDELKIAQSIKKGLTQEGMVVELAHDGLEGYEHAKTGEFDVVVLDLMLPVLDGMEVCNKLRADTITVPILMLTAKGLLDDKVNGLNAGADDYLVKPFAFAELIARIRALARRPQEVMQPTMNVADLEMNSGTYEVSRNGQEISISAERREFELGGTVYGCEVRDNADGTIYDSCRPLKIQFSSAHFEGDPSHIYVSPAGYKAIEKVTPETTVTATPTPTMTPTPTGEFTPTPTVEATAVPTAIATPEFCEAEINLSGQLGEVSGDALSALDGTEVIAVRVTISSNSTISKGLHKKASAPI